VPAEQVDSTPANRAVAGQNVEGASGPGRLERAVAERRVERFLEGFGMARGRRRELVIQNCVAHAMTRWRQEPLSDPGALALEEAEEALSRWFTAVLGPELIGEHPPLLVGRAAVAICEEAGAWPGVLSTCDRLPPAALEAMRRAGFVPTPAEEPGSMIEQQLDPWSAKELLTLLCGLLARLGRGAGGRTASVS
jgi:hypothetical protein